MKHKKQINKNMLIILITIYCDSLLYLNIAHIFSWSLEDLSFIYSIINIVVGIGINQTGLLNRLIKNDLQQLNPLDVSLLISLFIRPIISFIIALLCIINGDILSIITLILSTKFMIICDMIVLSE